jgi:hypothetical protein
MSAVNVWIMHTERKVLITDDPMPPVAVCGRTAEEAMKRGAGSKGFDNWNEADTYAKQEAKRLRYILATEANFAPWLDAPYYDEEYPR